nr:signal recognition particle 14 kDa protein-like isoform X1 [Tanacetum cinerariifolium]
VGLKDHQLFQASYATILKAPMTSLKKNKKKDKRKAANTDNKQEVSKQLPCSDCIKFMMFIGAWLVLIDEFVEHMYRMPESDGTHNLICECRDLEA